MGSIDIRPVAVDERLAATNTIRAALLNQPSTPEAFERRQASWDASDALGAWDGDRCVGHVAAFRFDTTVPGGGRLPTAGLTRVGVLPTHTRRGLLRTMIERLLRESRQRGQVLCSLLASEAPIYGRYGFGLATDDVAVLLTTAAATPVPDGWRYGSMRILAREESFDVLPALYERCARWRSGAINRDRWMWDVVLEPVAKPTDERSSRAVVAAVHTDDDGLDDGFVIYEAGWDDRFGGNPTASGTIHDLFGVSGAAERALWGHLIEVDLVRTWRSSSRPVDESIRRALRDSRAYETQRRIDELYLRALDVDAALGARTYGPAAGDAVIEVHDPLFDDNNGRWRIDAGGATRTDRPADVVADIAALSAAYLGGVAWSALAASGEIPAPADRDALAVLDALFLVHPPPYCGTDF